MGAPMLEALVRAGHDAVGFDVRPALDFKDLTARVYPALDIFSHNIETLITVVRDIPQTEAVLFSPDNGLNTISTLKRIILCSTLSPRYVRDLRARIPRHIVLIDAPMSGAQVAAKEARLSFMLGGTEKNLDAAHPLFDAMGQHFHRMGDFGAGMQAKVLNNLLAASHTAMTRLVMDWADTAGLDERKLLDLIHTSSGQNWFASGFDDIEFARDGLEPDNTIGILVKDVESALDAAPEYADHTLPLAVQNTICALKTRKSPN